MGVKRSLILGFLFVATFIFLGLFA